MCWKVQKRHVHVLSKIIMIAWNFLLFLSSLLVLCENNIVGLENYGQACYANAVFQLLYHNQDFRRSLEKHLTRDQEIPDHHLSSLHRTFLEMDRTIENSIINPNTFDALPDTFERGTQYDVAEVLQYYQSIRDFDWSPFTIEIQKHSDFFSEYFLELLLDVPEAKPLHLDNLLTKHFHLGGRSIKTLPKNLIMRIKRVRGTDEKITDTIIVQEEISLKPYCIKTQTRTSYSYRLEAFIEHCGTCTSVGHYIFYLHHTDSKYYMISDEKIKVISKQKYLEKASKAYLLFFKPNHRELIA